jgi:hypothetical protein
MPAGLEIRDPIHGFIYREPHEQAIVDSSTFQRLRRLKQLALANLVYPGANHTRFDHSLGAFHVASRLAEKLRLDSTDTRLIRLSALLHDIGHAPFSHVSEPILKKHSGDKIALQPKQQVHELISAQIILDDSQLRGLILESDRQKIVRLLGGEYGYTLLKDIVSGPVDVDKQDYLLRDSFFCGVKYGLFDIERLLNCLDVHDDGDDRFLAISRDGIHVLEQFVLAKYYMSTQVYRHRIRLITDEMIGRAISLGIESDGVGWLKSLYSYDGTIDFIKEYLTWNDERLTVKILEERPDTYVCSIFRRLTERRLLKCILDLTAKEIEDPQTRMFVFAEERDEAFHAALEGLIADRWRFDRNLVICNRITIKSAVKTESEVTVLHPGRPRLFREESTLFGAVNQAIQEDRFQVYAPAEYTDQRDKNRQSREFYTEILDMIARTAKPPDPTSVVGGS